MTLFGALLLCCLAAVPPLAEPPAAMSREETVVRTTYAKVVYAVQLGTIHDLWRELDAASQKKLSRAAIESRLAQDELRFEIRDVTSGDINEMAALKYADVVTKPAGEDVLQVTPVRYVYTKDAKETVETNARASWIRGQDQQGEDWNIPTSRVLAQIENGNWYSRYAAFTVKVDFRGRSRTARAIFLFGKNDKGEAEVLAIDMLTGNSALSAFARDSVYLATLLETNLRENPGIADWLRSHKMDDSSCQSGKREVCCDPVSLSFGVAAGDLR
jgi:hypothetical protein